jgi:hypothetical protein
MSSSFASRSYQILTDRRVRYAIAWAVCLALAGDRMYTARHAFDKGPPSDPAQKDWHIKPDRYRADGNDGHAQIDFGGQWVHGRMVAAGYADRLYDRNAQWEVVRAAYPRDVASPWVKRESFPKAPGVPLYTPDDPRHDDDWMMYWFMGKDSPRWADAGRAVTLPFAAADPFAAAALLTAGEGILTPDVIGEVNRKQLGGPLYPPIQAFLYAPLAVTNSPQAGYRAFQWVCLAATFLTGLAVSVFSNGRVWWPVATAAVMLYPGYRAGLELGQNAIVTLAVVAIGWAVASRGRESLGGAVWGLLAFKPVWAAAFFLVPLAQGRWRFCGAMLLSAAGLAAATLPFVGAHGWLDWLAVGREGSELYLVNKNWVALSRDLFGLPRRLLIDFTVPEARRGSPLAATCGWSLWGLVFVATFVVTLRRGDRRPSGLAAGFLALGAYLCCYRFMYYDALLSAFGVALLFADWPALIPPSGRHGLRGLLDRCWNAALSFPVVVLALMFVLENWLVRAEFEATVPGFPGRTVGTGSIYPWDTALILMLWLWAGWKLRRRS